MNVGVQCIQWFPVLWIDLYRYQKLVKYSKQLSEHNEEELLANCWQWMANWCKWWFVAYVVSSRLWYDCSADTDHSQPARHTLTAPSDLMCWVQSSRRSLESCAVCLPECVDSNGRDHQRWLWYGCDGEHFISRFDASATALMGSDGLCWLNWLQPTDQRRAQEKAQKARAVLIRKSSKR